MGCVKLYWYRPRLQNADALLIPTVVRLCVVLVSEASTRAMVLAEESGISLPSLFLVSLLCCLCQDTTQSSVVKMEGRQKGGGNVWWQQLCLLASPLLV